MYPSHFLIRKVDVILTKYISSLFKSNGYNCPLIYLDNIILKYVFDFREICDIIPSLSLGDFLGSRSQKRVYKINLQAFWLKVSCNSKNNLDSRGVIFSESGRCSKVERHMVICANTQENVLKHKLSFHNFQETSYTWGRKLQWSITQHTVL